MENGKKNQTEHLVDVEKVESFLKQIPELDRVAVLSWERDKTVEPVHLSDLFPDFEQAVELRNKVPDRKARANVANAKEKEKYHAQAINYGVSLEPKADEPKTLVESLKRAASQFSEHGLTYVQADGSEDFQSYAQIMEDAKRILGGLRALGLEPLDPVLFQFDSNRNFISAFWACILGGFLPTPVEPATDYSSMNDVVLKLNNSWYLLNKPIFLTDASMLNEVSKLADLWDTTEVEIFAVESLMGEPDEAIYDCHAGNLALNLLTSGSTGKPKCVQHRHQSVLAHAMSTSRYLELNEDDVILNWMPLDHVGGIVMMHLLGVFLGCPQVHTKIGNFITEPLKWLDWITKYRATHTWAPNFAFALINEHQDQIKAGKWDLSTVRYFLNGGEAVAPKTAHQFLEILALHGLSSKAMLPAYGMSETSSGCIHSRRFNEPGEENGVVRVSKSSLGGTIEFCEATDPDCLELTEVGEPVPGVMMRIVDEGGRVLPEAVIGRLQLAGPVIMAGYYKNTEANEEVFVGEGWFNTGDLGFIHKGRLTITGREKDVIIIHGKNHHNYEIEAFIEQLTGVQTSFSAACAVPAPHGDGETLAIFFVPSDNNVEFQIQVIRAIQQQVIRKIGISPGYVVPIEEHEFPKTGSGKIQRSNLAKRLLEGDFTEHLKRLDVNLGNHNTLPQWMYREKWVASPLSATASAPIVGNRLIFCDQMGLAQKLASPGEGKTVFVAAREHGEGLEKMDGGYRLSPHVEADFGALMAALEQDGFKVDHVLHLWNVTPYEGEPKSLDDLRNAVNRETNGLLYLIRAIAKSEQVIQNFALVTTALQRVKDDDPVAYEKSPLSGILRTIANEYTTIRCLHVDLPAVIPGQGHAFIEDELFRGTDVLSAYRGGTRLVRRLERVSLLDEGSRPTPVQNGGLYLITGGMGGIGKIMSQFLVEQHQADVVRLGRSQLSDEQLAELDEGISTEKGGSLSYCSVNIADREALGALIKALTVQKGKPLAGVIHLAGTLQRHLLAHQSPELLEQAFEAKVFGSYVIHQVLLDYPEALLINTSSAGTLTGDMMLGAYNAANGFVESLSAHRSRTFGSKNRCIAWGFWEQTGMSLEMSMMKDVLKRRGFIPISPKTGIYTLRRALMTDDSNLFVGLDGSKTEIRDLLTEPPEKEWAVRIFFSTKTKLSIQRLRALTTEYMNKTYPEEEGTLRFFPLVEFPELAHGVIDREELRVLGEDREHVTEHAEPRTLTEATLVPIWQDILDVPKVGIHDDFFGIGGHSLKAMQLVSAVRGSLGVELSLSTLFENPTIAELANVIQHVKPPEEVELGSSLPTTEESVVPMSYAQKQLWVVWQIEPDSPVYNNTLSFHLQGDLEVEVLEQSLQAIVDRHDILRTQFMVIDSEPCQSIRPEMKLEIPVLDLSHFPKELRDNKLKTTRRKEARTPFNLNTDPMIRALIVRMKPDSHYLVVSIHHIVFDDWSSSVLMNELILFYNAFLEEAPSPLPALSAQYSDFTLWQRGWFADGKLTPQLEYWKKQFSGGVPVLNLPTDYPRPAYQSYNGRTREIHFNRNLTESLRGLSRERGCTLYMTLLGMFATTLYRYSGQEEMVIGSVVAHRNKKEIESLIGYFVNTLPIYLNLSGNQVFGEFLEQVRGKTLSGFDNQDVPFEAIIDRLQIKRDPSRPSLCQALFTFQNLPVETRQMKDVSIDMEIEDNGTSKWDISMYALEVKDGLLITVEYNTDLFLDASVERFLGHFYTLVESCVRNPKDRLDKLAMVPGRERKELLSQFNKTRRSYPSEFTMAEWFEKMAAETPDKVAIVFDDRPMSYAELNQRANRVAWYLRTRWVAPDVVVGLMVERSHEMIVGMLAILKAGGAYLPINPHHPSDRIDYMVKDSGMPMLLTQKRWLGKHQLEIDCIDLENQDFFPDNTDNPENINAYCDMAYVIYTSGSTGRPKGVMIEHSSMVNILFALQDIYPLEETDSYLLKTSFTFDVSVVELFGWILGDGKLVILEPDGEKDPQAILSAIDRYDITHINFVPSALHLFLLDAGQIRVMEKLKYIFVAGEAVSASLVNRLFDLLDGVRVENLYGPTEATIYATYHSLSKSEEINVPIGQPIPNLQSYIINQEGMLQPINVAGELCIAGHGLARGYLNNPEMTNEKFVRNPNVPNQIMYRTGDLARWRSDGAIEYLGRIDDQVKVRGFRIELGEIKERLEQHDDINKAVVIAQKDDRGQAFLAAYLVSDVELNVSELRAFLAKTLPNYMVPAFFVPLDEVPLTPSGKLNRKALPAITGRISSSAAYMAPSTPVEEGLVGIWAEVLGMDRVGVGDNFFEIGGNSLSATMAVTRANKRFHVHYPLREIFRNPTIKAMAEYIETAEESIFDNIKAIEKRDFYPASSAQKRVYVIDYFQTVTTVYNMPVVVTLEGHLDVDRVSNAFAVLAARHDAFRTSFDMVDKEVIQKVADRVELPLQIATPGEFDIDETIRNFIKPFDLRQAPLARICLVKLFDERHLLLVDMHHVVTDGVSLSLLLEEFVRIYNGETLPELKVQYKDYSFWQNELMKSETIQAEREYWISRFSDQVPTLDWATDFPRPAVQQYEGDRLRFTLPEEHTEALIKFSTGQGVTLYMSLLASYFILLSKYVQQEDIVVGSIIAGRPHSDLEQIIGMFVNLLSMREKPRAELSVKEFLGHVKETVLGAFENSNYPFEEMVENLNQPRDLSRNPVFDTLFTLQNMAKPNLESEGLKITYHEYEEGIAKFDLIVVATEREGRVEFEFEFCTKIFKRETVQKMGEHYLQTILVLMKSSETLLGDLDISTRSEKNMLMKAFNETEAPLPAAQTLHGLFEAKAVSCPERIALTMGSTHMTYAQVKQRSDSLAMHLREMGLKVDQPAGLLLDRSMEMVVTMLAILKAGGAYLPLDPEHPVSRKDYILEDSGVSLLLTHGNMAEDLNFNGKVIDLGDSALFEWSGEAYTNINQPGDMAYILYTSGSTGQPKGVVLEHLGVVNTLTHLQRECPLLEGDAYLFKTTCTFDVSVTEIFGWFFGEGQLVILEPGAEKDPFRILKTIEDQGVTHLNYVPSALQMMLAAEDHLKVLNGLKYLMVAGEAIPNAMVRTLVNQLPDVMVENIYGPTEATIYATHYPIRNEEAGNVPIGTPIANTKAYILDKSNRLQLLNVPGELCIAGLGVARGYHNNPGLTAEKFIDNPLNPGERLYRTGDLARRRSDGNIEFFGRIDSQVKVRGYRIELDEIKTQLEKHESVREAIITVRKDHEDQSYLCAYFISVGSWTVADLRRFLLTSLPTYMVPAYFQEVVHFPKTASGKIDSKLLPEPDKEAERESEYVAPSSPLESRMVKVWEDVLDTTDLGVLDNFFDLGGDSIKAIQIASKFNNEQEKIFINDILQHQTIAEICRNIKRDTLPTKLEQGLLTGSREPLPPNDWFTSLALVQPGYFNQSFLLDLHHIPDTSALEGMLAKLIEHHDELRINLDPQSSKLIFNNNHINQPKVETVDLSHLDGEELSQALRRQCIAFKNFDLEHDVLVKALVLRTGADSAKMLLTMHHLVIDGVSWRIFLSDLLSLYRAQKAGQTIDLPPKTASLKQWRQYLDEYAESNELALEKSYWDAARACAFQLPLDRNPAERRIGDQVTAEGVLDHEQTDLLKKEVHKAYNTEIKDLLVTALARAVSEWTGHEDMIIDFEGHGRFSPVLDISRTMGWFTNMYPVKLRLKDEPIPSQVMAVKEQLRAVPNKGLGYGVFKYIKNTYPVETGERVPIRFNYLGEFDKEFSNEWFTVSESDHGPDISPDNAMSADIEINCMIIDDMFHFQANYNRNVFDAATMDRFKDGYINHLGQILEAISGKEEAGFTPSDFDGADMDQDDLDGLFD